jgi:tRNA pseudouridine55 synthase
MARKGKQVELKSQQVHISRLELKFEKLPDLVLEVECSKGTYIRSIARDLGSNLASGAYLTGLRRTRIGPYLVDEAISIENFIENLKLL